MKVYFVEIIRYGSVALGVQPYGIFDNVEEIQKHMFEYNQYRGGKYPEYYIREVDTDHFENCMGTATRVRFDVKTGITFSDSFD